MPQWKPDEQAHDEEAVDDEEEVPQWETPASAQEAPEPTVPQWVPPAAERSIGVRRKISKKREQHARGGRRDGSTVPGGLRPER